MSQHTHTAKSDYFQVIVLKNGQVNWQSAQLPGDFLVTSTQGNGRLAITLEENLMARPARLRFGAKSDSPRSKSDSLSWRSEASSPTASGSPSGSPLPSSRSMLNVRAVKEGVTISIPTSHHLPNETRSAPSSPLSAVASPNENASPLRSETSPSEQREMKEMEGSMSTLNVTVDPSPTYSGGLLSVSSSSALGSPSESPSNAWRVLMTPRTKQRAVIARMCQEWEKSGGCKRGIKCTFAHFNPAVLQPFQYCLDCQRCDFKDQTEYDAHIASQDHINVHTQKSQSRAQHSILRLKAEGSRKRCDYVDSPGGCKKGNRCPFSHLPLNMWLANQQAMSMSASPSPTNLIFVSPSH